MKKILKIFIILISFLWICSLQHTYAWVVDLWAAQWSNYITNHSNYIPATWDINYDLENLTFNILTIVKYIVSWLLVIFIVYIWIQMIISMWNDEEKLSTAKRQLWYTIIWIIFINIPWTIYGMFIWNKTQIDGRLVWTWSTQPNQQSANLFIDTFWFDRALNWWIILFIESLIFSVAVFVIIISGIKLITSRWREEEITETKNKIVWSIIWLMFIWFIEAWQSFVYNWVVTDWANLFLTIENLALFFAGPVAILFLTLAWWYYITSAWDEEKVKKAKNIVIYTIIATVILLAAHTFLKDLITLII